MQSGYGTGGAEHWRMGVCVCIWRVGACLNSVLEPVCLGSGTCTAFQRATESNRCSPGRELSFIRFFGSAESAGTVNGEGYSQ